MRTGIHTGWEPGWEPGYTRDGSQDGNRDRRRADPPSAPTVSSELLRNTPGFPGSRSRGWLLGRGVRAVLLVPPLSSSWAVLGREHGHGCDRDWLAAAGRRALPVPTLSPSPPPRAMGRNPCFFVMKQIAFPASSTPKATLDATEVLQTGNIHLQDILQIYINKTNTNTTCTEQRRGVPLLLKHTHLTPVQLCPLHVPPSHLPRGLGLEEACGSARTSFTCPPPV